MRVRGKLAAVMFTAQFGIAAQGKEHEEQLSEAPAYGFEAVYTAELWRNAQGGLRTGGVYLDNLDLTLNVDGERAWGLPGLTAFAYVLYNNSARFSERYVGDALTASNIDAPNGVRLYEAWLEWAGDEALPLSMRFGLYDLNSEFDSNDSRSLFINSTHGVGHEFGQTGENGPSIFPVTSLGLRLAWEPAEDWRILAVVVDGVPGGRDDPSDSGIHLSSEEGALGISEFNWSRGRVHKLSIGHWRYTAKFSDVRSTEAMPLPERRDNCGTYGAIELALDPGENPATLVFLRYGVAERRINEFDDSLGVGIRQRGLFASRPEDEIGLAFSRASVSPPTRSIAASMGTPRESYEGGIELTYRATINDWITIQPDLQFMVHPGVDPEISDSFALGLRVEFSMAAER